jgi:diphosphomevalonate decarboxylase
MSEQQFIPSDFSILTQPVSVGWQSPSNIALVKYWGKTDVQIPKNASLSFTLSACTTQTTIDFLPLSKPSSSVDFELFFEGKKNADFRPKIIDFFKRIAAYCPYLRHYQLTIRSSNSFPHSSGIASSASAMSALAMCIMELEQHQQPEMTDLFFKQKASFLARLGSGSACRSIEGPLVGWGTHSRITNSSDLYGVVHSDSVHPIFTSYRDTVLLVDQGQKEVSSTVGHNLMNGHPFSDQRFLQAQENMAGLIEVLAKGDVGGFVRIVELEALSLHAMMMTSDPSFVLMKPNTLHIIQAVRAYRKETGIPVCFTLDAGANVHLLYPDESAEKVMEWIENELALYCQNQQYIHDRVGSGAKKM